ncbi:MAG: hypothetical protein F6K23_00950 [Okeania sp. SIO2C9]|uniref:hypothetical protein n=1 Tax=Okeania sp. SIO2C9 TaxID=2607791 RepID=UPI0013C29694|nr:hypothetical protein [Okeania sp. SIO2C9]NEQ71774.1 hypothetical protein [Okeania sp. SIO2C9]
MWEVWEVWEVWGDRESRRNNCTCIFLCLSAFYPNFLVTQAENFALFFALKRLKHLFLSAFRFNQQTLSN